MTRILVVAAVLLAAVVAIWHPLRPPAISPVSSTQRPTRRAHSRVKFPLNTLVVVYVAGAVARPGIYRLTPGSRVGDAVALAGGLVAGADPLAVNLAARVSDGDEVAVTKIGETVRARSNAPRGRPRRVKTLPTQAVNLNESDAQTLATVPGIGAALAERIVAVRDADGAFTTFDELLDVAGMTTSRLDRAQPYLSI